jgi:hypothetical protein
MQCTDGCTAASAHTGRAILLAARQLVILLAHADEHTLWHVCLVKHVFNRACTLHIPAREDQQAGWAFSENAPLPACVSGGRRHSITQNSQ